MMDEGRKEGRREGGKEGRREGRKEGGTPPNLGGIVNRSTRFTMIEKRFSTLLINRVGGKDVVEIQ